MKLKYIFPILLVILLITACSTDNDDTPELNEVEGLLKIQELTNDSHTIELYTASGKFYTGYNAVSIRIKEHSSDTYVSNASLVWKPMMQMPSMQHSCPKSVIEKASGKKTVFTGFVIYQMTNLDGSGWTLTIDYSINGEDYSISEAITVEQSEKKNVTSFMGTDDKRYVVALIEPTQPIIGVNDIIVGVYKMENMMSFPVVEGYTLHSDPRMPGMGNHSSPNNTNLTYNHEEATYHGELSLTMTGYWVLNLKLANAKEEVLKGEDVTEEHTQSSLYLELQF
ncbi:hypothetical protein [Snuella sedimenti]|uniref:YtkA-like domain-containing protein n=1 Tax=Snuella sedimenti TaxID=2798802 RepID=A0A8J7LMQ8_9FLAO|nr:hypothetical protein [Snuella sedimenti]MBJ6366973.1 hypothetical protein [Snuella sedimenti]